MKNEYEKHVVCSGKGHVSVILCDWTMGRIGELYPWLVENGYDHQRYQWSFETTCFENAIKSKCMTQEKNSDDEHDTVLKRSLHLDQMIDSYGDFLNKLFDLWFHDRMLGKEIFIREFENLAGAIGGGRITSCGMGGGCPIRTQIPKDCMRCRWVSICRGGCPIEADENGKSNFCNVYQQFYLKAVPNIIRLLRELNHRRYK